MAGGEGLFPTNFVILKTKNHYVITNAFANKTTCSAMPSLQATLPYYYWRVTLSTMVASQVPRVGVGSLHSLQLENGSE